MKRPLGLAYTLVALASVFSATLQADHRPAVPGLTAPAGLVAHAAEAAVFVPIPR